MLKTLKGYIGQYKKASILTPIFTALEVLLEVLIPFVTASLIDKGINSENMSEVIKYGLFMLFLAFLSLFCGIESGKYAAEASTGFAANIRDGMYKKIQTYSFSNIDKFSTAGLVTRLTTDVTNLQNAYMMIIRVAIRPPLMLGLSVIMCILISPSLSMIFAVALVFLGIMIVGIIPKVNKIFTETFNKYDDLNAEVQENVTGVRVVKAYVREEHEKEKFSKAAHNLRILFEKAEGMMALMMPIMNLAVYGCIIALSWFGAKQIVGGSLTTGQLTSMFSYVMSILMSLMMLSMTIVMITMSFASARRISAVLNEVPDIQNPENPIMEVKDGSIDFNHVSFAYTSGSGEDVLSDIDLHIHSGETIGIIGGTGSGKSSFVSLISRLYDVTKGNILVGGKDVKVYDVDTLRNEVSVVLQKNVLFSGTVLDNLRWGNENATEEECWKACELACADEFLKKMPEGLYSRVEQSGNNFSGGQKQRLCIARALLKNPKILILDDSTSAVDTATDAKIQASFHEQIPDTTKILISQRISSVKNADRIIVIDDGKISGFDSHENLIKNNEIYQEIEEAQNKAGGDFDKPEAD
jgi:ATP-binding cassette, subfamily B, multidrug efflux pump